MMATAIFPLVFAAVFLEFEERTRKEDFRFC
jgi:hypothetical protein